MIDLDKIFGPKDDGQKAKSPAPQDGGADTEARAAPQAPPPWKGPVALTNAAVLARLTPGRPHWALLADGRVEAIWDGKLPAGAKYVCTEGDKGWIALPHPIPLRPPKGGTNKGRRPDQQDLPGGWSL